VTLEKKTASISNKKYMKFS